jgi:hypothetical protein
MNDTESHNIPIEKMTKKKKHIKKCFIYIFVKDFHLLIKQNNWILGKEKKKLQCTYCIEKEGQGKESSQMRYVLSKLRN